MRKKHKFKIKHWKLTLLGLAFVCLFASLGVWQLSRAAQKQQMINSYTKRVKETAYTGANLNNLNDWRFYRAQLTGHFDNEHTILLDNKTHQGRVGYDVYTPFHTNGLKQTLLVNRGFIPLGANRETLPTIQPIQGKTTIIGMLNLPPLYVSLGKMHDNPTITWPLRVQFISLPQLGELLNTSLFPYVVILDPNDPRAYQTEWAVTLMSPDKHRGYAVQWFAIAATLLIITVALNRVR